jgi:hypothetical protein
LWGDLATVGVCDHNSLVKKQTVESDNLPVSDVFTVDDGTARRFTLNTTRVAKCSYWVLMSDAGDVWGYLLDLRDQVLESVLAAEDVPTLEIEPKLNIVHSPAMCVLDRFSREYHNTGRMVRSTDWLLKTKQV